MLSVEMKDDRSEIIHYDFEDYPIYIRKALLSSYSNFEAPAHWHDDIEFIAVQQGEMNYNVNGEIITVKENEGIFVNSRQLHCGFSRTKSECDFICILVHPMLLCVSRALEQNYVVPLLTAMPYIKLSADVPWQNALLGCITDMYRARDDAAAPLTVSALFLKAWSIIFANSNASVPQRAPSSDFTTLKNMIGYIQKFYREKVSLADIALSGAVGQSKCCKLFDKYIGVTPNTYLTQYRLNQSMWYLKNTDMTITETAQAVGFSGSSYYAEAFRKWCNQRPSEYRKANRSFD